MFLIVREGSEMGRTYKIREGNTIAGRNPTCQISLVDDFSVSREHLRISCKPDGSCTVTDLNATNGSYLNGRRLLPNVAVPLEPGGFLRIGKTLFEAALDRTPARIARVAKPGQDDEFDTEKMGRRAGKTDREQSQRAAKLATDYLKDETELD
jgi:pSer/pThr/pTyr-binding forkhead associated (FHA) protein